MQRGAPGKLTQAAAACYALQEDIPDGFDESDYEAEVFEIWPDCWPAWQLFMELSGQWRFSGMGGCTALDYTPLFMRMDRMGLCDEAWNNLFFDIRVIERAALEAMQKK